MYKRQGTYDETNPLVIEIYLEDISKTNGGKAVSSGEKSKQWTEKFSPNDTKHEFAQIRFAPLTGTEFEKKGYTYSNYKAVSYTHLWFTGGNGSHQKNSKRK